MGFVAGDRLTAQRLNCIAIMSRRSDRLDWMYQGGMLAKQEAEKRTEEAMMTGKPLLQEESAEQNRVSCL